ncbi:helix-turn-helix domain-containing protein [Solirhodobacter olei]|uniref:helix-turn-helix domain-containing protein n=1 Tax=Solirhodobacter olei TaxID=2493082 RepID=UPI000FDB8D3C|nr:helix-turn-helix transcriptional regulator [Solirhodobacter olei]
MDDRGDPHPGFTLETTRDVRQQDQVDYWRSLHPSLRLDVPKGRDYRAFDGERLLFGSRGGSAVCYAQADDMIGHFQGSHPDFLLLSLVMAGATEFRPSHGTEVVAEPGAGFLVLDSGSSIRSRSHDCAHAYLTLPKHLIDADPATLTGEQGISLLPETGLLRFLRLQLQEIPVSGRDLGARSAEVAVENTVELAVAALNERSARRRAAPKDRDLFEAARALIEIRAAEAGLTASAIAEALGCSRAQLYRVFSDRDLGIGQMIRTTRLARAKALLETHDTLPIKVIATMSGYENAASFSRAFLRREGVSPDRYRASLH